MIATPRLMRPAATQTPPAFAAPAGPRPDAAREGPLRVCHVMSADLWAGAEVQLATTAAYLAAQPDVRLSAVLFNEGRLAAELRDLGVPVTVIDEARTSAAGIVRSLTRCLTSLGVDVVNTHRDKDTVLGALAALLAGVPHVVRTVHGLREPLGGWAAVKARAYDALERMALRSVDVVIAVSDHTADALRRSGVRPARVTAIHNGIAPPAIRPPGLPARIRRELGIGPDALVIGTAGRLVPVKGHDGLLRAMAVILRVRPDARLVVAGGGPLRATLDRTARRLGIDRACVFTGHRPDVRDVIAAMDVFVLPSLSEGIPMALLEAMAIGTPVVATRVGGIPEVVEDGVTGVLVAPGDDAARAEACLELARHRDRARRLALAAGRRVSEDFSRERCGRALLDTYRDVVRGARPGGDRGVPPGLARRGLRAGARMLRRAVERRRMRRLRREPAPVITALRSARTILIVCHGNIIRSPFAAALVARLLGPASRAAVRSAGLEAIPGRPAHTIAVEEADTRQVDLHGHTASRLSAEMVRTSDVIFVMDVPQLVAIAARFPAARAKTFLLASLAHGAPLEIDDPVDGDASVFQTCFTHISGAVGPIARVLMDGVECQ